MAAQDDIVAFLKGKGLNRAAIAGIMGNLMAESGFNPNNPNVGEGAQGIAQWEGGRLAGLRSYASSHGLHDTDLKAQLGYMWQELSGPYSGVLSQLKSVTSAAQAASIWDSQYEVSAGTTRDQRINYAQQFYTQGALNGVSTSSSGEAQAFAGSSSSGGSSATGSSSSTPAAPIDYAAALSNLSGILTSVPELSGILQQAQTGGWSTDKFLQSVQTSKWWRTHNDSARQLIGLQLADPAEYKTKLQAQRAQLEHAAATLGVQLGPGRLNQMVTQSLIEGWDQQTTINALGAAFFNPKNPHQALSGNIATAYTQMKQTYEDYGVPVTDATLRNNALRLAEGVQTLDAYKSVVVASAKSMYPSLVASLDHGMTVKDIAAPYVQTMAGLLEVDPSTLTVSDPTIKRALQGSVVNTPGGKPTATSTTLYDFEKQVRTDPRWAKTQNATDTVSTALRKIGQDFGFAGA